MVKQQKVTPFLRWVGGKRWLVNDILKILPASFNRYHEPFLGGGSVFFSLKPNCTSNLSDSNLDLINTYKQVRNNPSKIISVLKGYKNDRDFYNKIRNSTFKSPIVKAANFIFLNKTSFNGIYRVNSKGIYNVPYGGKFYKEFINEDNLIEASKLLKKCKIEAYDFAATINSIEKGDLVYLDPPYTVSHGNNGFVEYNQKIFSWEDQLRLAEFVGRVIEKKGYFVLSNAAHPSINSLYKKFGKRIVVNRPSTIGGRFAKRIIVSEYIFTNCI